MIILDTINKSLEVLLAGVVATSQLPLITSYVDVTTTTYVPSSNDSISNNTTAITLVAAPVASTQRQVKLITVYNADTAPATVTVRLNNSGTFRQLVKVTLGVGYTLVYTDGEGFRVIDTIGSILGIGASGATGAPGPSGLIGLPGIPGLDAEEHEFPYLIPGPRGSDGAQGLAGVSGSLLNPPMPSVDGMDGEDGYFLFGSGGGGGGFTPTYGTWTPNDASGASLTFSNVEGQYVKSGRLVVAWGNVAYPSTANTNGASVGGLPFTTSASVQAIWGGSVSFSNFTSGLRLGLPGGQTAFVVYQLSGSQATNLQLSGLTITFFVIYLTS